MKLSIIIVNYNTIGYLRECLTSVGQFGIKEMEVFVVDNASNDGSPNMVNAEFPWVKLITNNKNIGFAPANNQALRQCSGKFIMLLNSDTLMLEDTINRIVSFMEQHPEAGVVGCKLLNTDGSLQPSATSFPNVIKDTVGIALKGNVLKNNPVTRAIMSRVGRILGMSASRFDEHLQTKETDYPRGACFTMRREALDQVGLLDEEYFFTGEEMDWCYRAKQKGWKVYYYPEAAVIHHDHGATKQIMGKVFVQTRKSALRFYQKHYSPLRTELMKLLVSLVLLWKCIFASIMLVLRPSKRILLLAQRESCWALVKVHYLPEFRKLNVFSEMPFRYN
jgi:GT2 family glycosyltransferase